MSDHPTYELCQGIRRVNNGWVISFKTGSHRDVEIVFREQSDVLEWIEKNMDRIEGYL